MFSKALSVFIFLYICFCAACLPGRLCDILSEKDVVLFFHAYLQLGGRFMKDIVFNFSVILCSWKARAMEEEGKWWKMKIPQIHLRNLLSVSFL